MPQFIENGIRTETSIMPEFLHTIEDPIQEAMNATHLKRVDALGNPLSVYTVQGRELTTID